MVYNLIRCNFESETRVLCFKDNTKTEMKIQNINISFMKAFQNKMQSPNFI